MWRRDLAALDVPVRKPEPDLVSHLDVTPQNVVVRRGRATGLVDLDLAGPTTRLQLGGGWARMWVEGAGDTIRRRQAWLVEQRERLLAALTGG